MMGPSGKQAIPEERFTVERLVRTINERRPHGADWKGIPLVQGEQRPFAFRLLDTVWIGIVGRHQRSALAELTAFSVHGDTRHEDVTSQTRGRTGLR
jgi:hypothetical protein